MKHLRVAFLGGFVGTVAKLSMAIAAAFVFSACGSNEDGVPTSSGTNTSPLISDQVHNNGTPGFYFLPPTILQAPPAFKGTFDPNVKAVARVCKGTGTCDAKSALAVFSASGGTGGGELAKLRVLPALKTYTAVWDTRKCATGACSLVAGAAYRLHIYATMSASSELELGYADIQVFALTLPVKLDTRNFSPLLKNLPYVIAFRVEKCATVACAAPDQCHSGGSCNPSTGACSAPLLKPNGTACSDGNACTQADKCQAGVCTGSNPVVCSALDQCHVAGVCNTTTGVCSNPSKPNGTSCNDGNACTQTDICQAGICTGSNPVVCSALDQCHQAGVCNTSTGMCSNPNKPDGNACNDANACTQTDICQAGVCIGSNPVICKPIDQCHDAGSCDPMTSLCSIPAKPDGIACSDGNACTQTDKCQAGVCTGSNPVVCSALDQCHDAGVCNSTTGVCSNPNKTDGTGCNDGNACTQTDVCQAGICTGSNPVVCVASDQCHLSGICDPSSGVCSSPNKTDGTGCNDGNACTQTDVCQAGACVGSNPVVCVASDQCHLAGSCNPTSGACSNPATMGGSCGIAKPIFTPSFIVAGNATALSVNVFIPGPTPETVNLVLLDTNNQPIQLLASLNDDGVSGDQKAGDNIYSASVTLPDVSNQDSARFRIVADIAGSATLLTVDFAIPVVTVPEIASDSDYNAAVDTVFNSLASARVHLTAVASGSAQNAQELSQHFHDAHTNLVSSFVALMAIYNAETNSPSKHPRILDFLFSGLMQEADETGADGDAIDNFASNPDAYPSIKAFCECMYMEPDINCAGQYYMGSQGNTCNGGFRKIETTTKRVGIKEWFDIYPMSLINQGLSVFGLVGTLISKVGGYALNKFIDVYTISPNSAESNDIALVVGTVTNDEPVQLLSGTHDLLLTFSDGSPRTIIRDVVVSPGGTNTLTVYPGEVSGLPCVAGTISGMVFSGVTVNVCEQAADGSGCLSGGLVRTTITDPAGRYTVCGLVNGNYSVIPFMAGYSFRQASIAITVSGVDVPDRDFLAIPSVSVLPTSGLKGKFFLESGSGFTHNGSVTLYFQKPDRTQITKSTTADNQGNYAWTYDSSTADQYGTYSYWAVDAATGLQSNTATFQITAMPGIITTVAGNGARSYSGDGGPAVFAELDMPYDVAVNSLGNIFIADQWNHRVRKVDTLGIITTVAGNGNVGDPVDGGLATSAKLGTPWAIAFDSSDNLYIVDDYSQRIRRVDTLGIITTVAGGGDSLGDGGPATSAALLDPIGIAVDSSGNLYIADRWIHTVRKVDTSGIINRVAGNGTVDYGYSGDGGPATNAKLHIPAGLAVDSLGNLYIADNGNNCIRKVDTFGIITTVAGNGNEGYSGDGGPATSAELRGPWGVAVDSSGNIFIADQWNHRVRKVDTLGIITTVTGNGNEGYSGDGGPATAAELDAPFGIAVDSLGNLYIADYFNSRIRKVFGP